MLTTATLAQVVDPHQGELLQPDGAHLQLERLLRLQEQSERRQRQRYPIFARSEYILAGNRAQATTLNISSGGVFLKTDQLLPVGERIQVFINWPVLLDQRCPLRLLMTGRVLRSDEAGAAVRTLRYDFKIRVRGSNAVPSIDSVASIATQFGAASRALLVNIGS
jgi:hypothetical protein